MTNDNDETQLPLAMDGERRLRGYMCTTAWTCEAGVDGDGTTIYWSERAVRERGCVIECGLVEVEVTIKRVVQEGKL